MNIELEGGRFVIRASREYLIPLRGLPDRSWNPALSAWEAAYTVENYDYMAAQGWPVDQFERPTLSSIRIELATYKSETYFAIFTPVGKEWTDVCSRIPESRMWSSVSKCWLCKPTIHNVRYLSKYFNRSSFSEAAITRFDKIMDGILKFMQKAEATVVEQPKIEVTDFKFKTEPYQHQINAFAKSRDREAYALFMEQGTGKTKVAIDTAAWLRSKNEIEAMVVICPNDVKDVWPEELAVHMPEWVQYEVAVDGRMKRVELEKFVQRKRGSATMKILVTNVEAMASKERFDLVNKLISAHPALVVVDESTRFKNPRAKRTKALLKLGKNAKYRRIMTGTPMTQSPLDLYAPCKFLDHHILGFSTFVSMVKHHGILGGFQGKQVVGFQKVEEINEKLKPHAFRVLRVDCLDLPPKIFMKHYIDLSPEQRRFYNELRDELVTELGNGLKVSAAHALVKIVRLAQIVGGFVKPDATLPDISADDVLDDTQWNERAAEAIGNAIMQIGGTNPKLETTLDIIEQLKPTDKVIIWARFRAEIELIQKKLSEIYGEESVVTFYGGVPRDERTERRHRFQGTADRAHDPKCRFFVAQVDTGSVGLTLTRAQTVIYYSNSFSLETRLQSEDRTHRIGQNGAVTYHDLIARDTLDTALIGALRRKKKFADMVTGDAWKEWL